MKDCPLTNTLHGKCGLQSEGCEFKHTCQQMLEDEDRTLLRRLHDAEGLIRYYEAAEGEWARETEARKRAYMDYSALRAECENRGLDIES